MPRDLAERQRELLFFLRDFIQSEQRWPSYREIMAALNWNSNSTVATYLRWLHEAGYLGRDSSGYFLDVDFAELEQGIPVLGIITAGGLQEAVEVDLGVITLHSIIPYAGDTFAVLVSGSSMVEAGIEEGDYVLLRKGELQSGQIGAVLYNGETTLKRIFLEPDAVRMVPANGDHDEIVIRPSEFEEIRILGRYVGRVGKRGVRLER